MLPGERTGEPRPTFGGYLGGTEGIRGIFCMFIVAYHCWLYTGGESGPPTDGWFYTLGITRVQLGLMVFFMLSAFLLYRPFVQSIMRGRPRPSFGAYLANRVLRIFPVYWVILSLSAILGLTIVWVPVHEIGFDLGTFVANFFLVHGLHPSGMQTGVPPAWSLAVEWVFYLMLPLLVMLALRVGGSAPSYAKRRIALLVPAGLLVLLGIAGIIAAERTWTPDDPSGVLNTWHAVISKSFLPWAALFGAGMAIAVLRVDLEDKRLQLPWWWRRVAIAGWLGLSFLFIWAQYRQRLDYQDYNLLMTVPLALFLCAIVLFEGDHRRDVLMRIFEWGPAKRLGEWSLSIYLLHYPIIVLLVDRTDLYRSGWGGMAWNVALTSAITVALAYVSHRYVELPAMRRKVRTKAEGPPPVERVEEPPAALEPVPVPAQATTH